MKFYKRTVEDVSIDNFLFKLLLIRCELKKTVAPIAHVPSGIFSTHYYYHYFRQTKKSSAMRPAVIENCEHLKRVRGLRGRKIGLLTEETMEMSLLHLAVLSKQPEMLKLILEQLQRLDFHNDCKCRIFYQAPSFLLAFLILCK